MALATYSSRDVKVTWAGAPIDGLSVDDFVTISRNEDLTDEEVGADGQAQLSFLPNRSGTVTISLQQNSRSNRKLSALLLAQEENGELYRGSLIVASPDGSIIARMKGAHLKAFPELSQSSSASGNNREWTFWCEEIQFLSVPEGVADDAADAAEVSAFVDTIVSNAQT